MSGNLLNIGCGDCCTACTTEVRAALTPNLTIEGMTPTADWVVNTDLCCATRFYVFNTTPAWTYTDAGNVMTYDKTQTITREFYYSGHHPLTPSLHPRQCPTVLTAHYKAPSSGGDPGYTTIPSEPAYVNCCMDVQVVNTRVTATRIWGGRRFITKSRPSGIFISIQFRSTNCDDVIENRYILTSTYSYEGQYAYVDYNQQTVTITNTSTEPCWGGNTITPTGSAWSMPGDFSGSSYGASFCRRLVMSEEDYLAATQYAFTTSDTASGCTVLDSDCFPCTVYATSVCLNSAPTITEPSTGFCTPSTIGYKTYTNNLILCMQHSYAMYDDDTDEFLYCAYWSPSAYDSLSCTNTFVAVEFGVVDGSTGSGFGSSCGNGPDFAGACDVLSFTCTLCLPGSPSPPAAQTFTITTFPCRLKAASESIACSGYTARSVCLNFTPWTFTVTP